jgi:hypothetical protein
MNKPKKCPKEKCKWWVIDEFSGEKNTSKKCGLWQPYDTIGLIEDYEVSGYQCALNENLENKFEPNSNINNQEFSFWDNKEDEYWNKI